MAAVDDLMRSLDSSLTTARTALQKFDDYYEGNQAIKFVAPAMMAEFDERITALVINWPRVVADAFEARLDVEGFRYAGDSDADDDLWDVWQANDLDEQSQQAHLDSIALSRSYAIVGSPDSDDDPPVVTVESPMQVFARRDPRTRQVMSAWKRWDEYDDLGVVVEQNAVLYLPDSTTHLVAGADGWKPKSAPDKHGLGRVPVVPLVNRPRILRPDGVSEFVDVIPLADAANKMATDMMVSGEFHAMPRRWAAGIKQDDFTAADGTPLNPWQRNANSLWATENPEAKFGQFDPADLTVFHETIKLLAQLAGQMAALPPHYLAFVGDNPTSADAIRSAETQLVKKCERKQTYLGGAWEDVMRLVLRFVTGAWDSAARRLETLWRDPSTPTVAQKADAIVKLATPLQGGRALVPIEQGREDLGYTAEQRERMAEMDRRAETDSQLQSLIDRIEPGGSGDAATARGGNPPA